MSSIKIATAFAVIALFAGPALAGDNDLATEQVGSGRIIGTDAGSSVKGAAPRHGYSSWPHDFQLQGR